MVDLRRVFVEIAKSLKSGITYILTFEVFDERTHEQNKKMHAMLADIAKQAKHLNQVLDEESWKRLCVKQFADDCIENDIDRLAEYWRKQNFRIIPSLDGKSLVMIGAQTRKFPRYVAAGFVEWLYTFGSENNIQWSDPEQLSQDEEYERRYAA